MTITQPSLKNKPPTNGGEQKSKTANYRQWRDDVAALLQEKGFFDEAERWDYCDDSPRTVLTRKEAILPSSVERVYLCSRSYEHDAVLLASSCDFRICPDCAPRHTARLINHYLPVIDKQMQSHPHYHLKTITFTRSVELGSPDFGKIASDGFKLIQKAMLKAVGPDWNKKGAGLLANWEVGPNGKKLHYHAIYLGPFVPYKPLSDAWAKLTGGDWHVWLSAVKNRDSDWQEIGRAHV